MEEYRSIIDDWEAFCNACETPPVPAIRRNPLKAHEAFADRLQQEFPDAHQTDWSDTVYRLPRTASPGKSLLHWRGAYYVQEASAAVPVMVLDPQPGEDVLDMAAAPGGKTTQIAARMDNQGRLVANDANPQRLQSLFANIYRTGAACTLVTNYEGQNMPEDERYDRILVDAPCSGEGNECRRSFEPAGSDQSDHLANLQQQLLMKAADLLRPGGTLVYSTCTFTPAENEAVVQSVLDATDLSIEPVDIAAPHQRGITGFDGNQFSRDMRNTVRIYPHHLDSGGMFVAKFSG
jgi:NOL1/NOP2/sun family putative RNA methylase